MTVTDVAAAMPAAQRRKEIRRVVLSSYLGSTIEFYDFLLYATAASLVFGPVFFAGLDPLAATVASYGTFAAGYLARPLGGALFGHFGDRLGRKRMLLISMSIMGLASFCIGLIPPPALIGSWAAILLVLLRIGQGVALGGEWGGAALMALEHSEKKRRGFAASFTNAGAPTGAVLGTVMMGIFSSLPRDQFLNWGWRVPFLLSGVLLVVGLFVRARVSESPIFRAATAEPTGKKPTVPVLQVLRRPKNLLLTTFGCSASFAMQILFATFAITYGAAQGSEESVLLFCFSLASFSQIFTVIGLGRLSDTLGRRPVMVAGLVLFTALLYPILHWVASGNVVLIFLAFFLGLNCHAMTYGPMAAFISEQFGTTARYTGASLGYQLATLIGAGLTPILLTSLYAASGKNILSVFGILAAVSSASMVAILLTRESKDNELTQEKF
ncbi:putative MFS family arabinose efflux permease [Halopolyspora algeriensis]|uniref:Putative MFS family arabinose efflux permease n=1 Tax=Halopolyspora algeriensis TaxID=1500506 RepID=A0A368VVT8_9ACTN|nr:MFS transporter [Halopolyspora algeriensis]RCW45959.1 putative MFS family arabinose efflux permease [Halopolyspora algeriensis]TQM55372.1 putative MFS family arabinose efflux permease [Halopolyspora algeriensis]